MQFVPTGHTFGNDGFSFAILDYRRVCVHTCGIPLISGMSGLGFLMEYLIVTISTYLLGGHPSTNKCKKQYQKFEALNIWKETTFTWLYMMKLAPKTHAKTPAKQTFQTEEIWNISSMEMRRLWNWILDPNGSCQGRIRWIKFKVNEPNNF